MGLSVRYRLRRREVWRWYWLAWRRLFWKLHVVIFLVVSIAVSFILFGRPPEGIKESAVVAAIGLVPVAAMALYPILRFKRDERVLTVDRKGLSTVIGTMTGEVTWGEIGEIRDEGDGLVIIRRNLNAFIVPERAFATAEARSAFVAALSAGMAGRED